MLLQERAKHFQKTSYFSGKDSEILRRVASTFSGERCLEIGIGYGSNLLQMREHFGTVVGTDLYRTEGFNVARNAELVISDSATCFREEIFDLILLNPPYLPSAEIEDPAVDGGPAGFQVAEKFLRNAAFLIKPFGTILIVMSSLNSSSQFDALCNLLGLRKHSMMTEGVFFEQLIVFQLSRN